MKDNESMKDIMESQKACPKCDSENVEYIEHDDEGLEIALWSCGACGYSGKKFADVEFRNDETDEDFDLS